jgi:hypothetical protein
MGPDKDSYQGTSLRRDEQSTFIIVIPSRPEPRWCAVRTSEESAVLSVLHERLLVCEQTLKRWLPSATASIYFPSLCSKIHSINPGSAYARSHETCPTPGYSV